MVKSTKKKAKIKDPVSKKVSVKKPVLKKTAVKEAFVEKPVAIQPAVADDGEFEPSEPISSAKPKDVKFIVLNILLIIGMFAALFLIYEHFVPSASEFCSFGQNVDCGIVNKSPYATLDGFSYLLTIDYGWPLPLIDISGIHPVLELLMSNAFLGLLTLIFVFLLLHAKKKGKNFLFVKHDSIMKWIVGVLGFGVLYGLYLFYIQHSILKTYCPFCIAIDVILISSLFIALKIKKEEGK